MRRLIFGVTALAGLSAFALGPRANPDDQFRFFTFPKDPCYEDLVRCGFNQFVFCYRGTWDEKNDCIKPKAAADMKRHMDRVLADGFDYALHSVMAAESGFKEKYPRILRDGKPYSRNPDVAYPPARDEALKGVAAELKAVANHPALTHYIPTGEVRDGGRVSFRPYFREAYRRATGREVPAWAELSAGHHYSEIPGFPVVSRVVEDNDPNLGFFDWFWLHGDGWNDYNDAAAALARKYHPNPMDVEYEPAVRTPPLRGSGGAAMTAYEHWIYPYPEPYNVRFLVAEMKAMAKGHPGMLIRPSVQPICYRSFLAPKEVEVENPPEWVARCPDVTYLTTPPDIFVEGFWASVAARADAIGTFSPWSFFDMEPRGVKNPKGYAFTNGETVHALSNFMHTVAIPLGPLFRAVPDRQADVAVLESRASDYFVGPILGGWLNNWRWGPMADAAHLQPDVLYEEDLAKGGVPSHVKVVIAPRCEVLTRSAFEALKRFQARGGILVGDGRLPPELLQDIDLFELPNPYASKEYKDGVKSAALLREGARKLKRDLAPFVTPPADSDNEFIVTFVRSYGRADYLFAINDKRTFGTYTGQWKRMMEKGVPNEGTVTMPRTAGAVYDLVRHRSVPFSRTADGIAIPLSYATNDGRLLMIVDRPLGSLSVSQSATTLEVRSPDAEAMIPIGVFADGAKPRYGVVKDGTYSCPLPKGKNVRVLNLADGRIFAAKGGKNCIIRAWRGLVDWFRHTNR